MVGIQTLKCPCPFHNEIETFSRIFLLGLATDAIGRRTKLPRVTLLLAFGFGIGPSGLDWIPGFDQRWFPMTAHVSLAMVGFLLGNALSLQRLRRRGRGEGVSVSVSVPVPVSVFPPYAHAWLWGKVSAAAASWG